MSDVADRPRPTTSRVEAHGTVSQTAWWVLAMAFAGTALILGLTATLLGMGFEPTLFAAQVLWIVLFLTPIAIGPLLSLARTLGTARALRYGIITVDEDGV